MKFDFTNAYNSLLRSKNFQIVHQHCPQPLPFKNFQQCLMTTLLNVNLVSVKDIL